MNFDMAGDLVEFEDIATTTVLLADDVASAAPEEREKRRGVAGMVYAFKLAGAAAEAGLDLAEVTRVAQKAADACRSVGAALSSCTVPQAGRPTFEIAEDEMEMGMGIHGEPGVWRDKLRPADAIAGELMDRLLADAPVARGRPGVDAGQQPRRDAAGGALHPLPGGEGAARRGRGGDRDAAGRPLRHLDGDGRRVLHADPARRRARGLAQGALRLRLLERAVSLDRAALARGDRPAQAAMDREADRLNAADGALGDGDLGVTMTRGMALVAEAAPELPDDLGQALLRCAQAFTRSSGSSYGTLLATGLMAMAKARRGGRAIEAGDLAGLVAAARDAMAARGKAELGGKTVLDSLDAVARALDGVTDPDAAAEAAPRAARAALEAFRERPATVGRARIFAEKSRGLDDPGMLAMALIVEAIAGGSPSEFDLATRFSSGRRASGCGGGEKADAAVRPARVLAIRALYHR